MARSLVALVTPALAIAGMVLAFPMALLHVRYDVAPGHILETFPTELPGGTTRISLRYEFLAPSPSGKIWYIGHAQAGGDTLAAGHELEVPADKADSVADGLRGTGVSVFYRRKDPQGTAFIVTSFNANGWRHRSGVVLIGLALVLWLPLRRLSMRNTCA